MSDATRLFSDHGIELEVDASAGGRVSRLRVRDLDLLVGRDDAPLAWGSYPMVPFAGRIAFGRFTFRGAEVSLPVNLPPHAAHGFGFTSEWRWIDDNAISVDFDAPWPFRGSAIQRFVVDDRSLTCSIEVRAVDAQPVMAGWHPWFRRELDDGATLELHVDPGQMYELDDMIPTGRLVEPPDRPWDNCFVDLAAPPLLRWSNGLRIEVTSSCSHWVVYDEPEHAICVEPQTGAPDEANREPLVLIGGDRLQHSMTLHWGSS